MGGKSPVDVLQALKGQTGLWTKWKASVTLYKHGEQQTSQNAPQQKITSDPITMRLAKTGTDQAMFFYHVVQMREGRGNWCTEMHACVCHVRELASTMHVYCGLT